jgi:hypothetical protein
VRKTLQKANRYYVSTSGGSLLKASDTKEISLVAGEMVTVINSPEDVRRPIKYSWYVRQANKIIQQFLTKQAELF